MLSSVLMAVMMVAMSIGQTAAPIIAAAKAASAASDFFAVIDAPKPSITGLKEPDVSAHGEICFESVNFAYPSRPHVKVLDDLNVCFQPGKITAIVGASGSGKSTIVGLLERWYELDNERVVLPESAMKAKNTEEETNSELVSEAKEQTEIKVTIGGSILIGGQNLDKIDLKWWRSQIGLVQQEPFIFNDTIAKNVEYGLIGSKWENEDAQTKRDLVEQACKEAFADEYISRLPMVR
jgi:ATP-binding cassette subfamily B (MDR/TAP) protein 1